VIVEECDTGKSLISHILGRIQYNMGAVKMFHFMKVGRDNLMAHTVSRTIAKTCAGLKHSVGGVQLIARCATSYPYPQDGRTTGC